MAIENPERAECPFCKNLAGTNEYAVIEERAATVAFVNPRQLQRGAALIIPRRHASTILDLAEDEVASVAIHTQRVANAVAKAFSVDGINIFQNNGVAAGQSVGHYHVHVLPRWQGDGHVPLASQTVPITPLDERLTLAAMIAKHLPR